MTSPGTCMIVHNKPGNRTSWGHHGKSDWYIGPSLDHSMCMKCYMPAIVIVRITDTIQYIPKGFAFPKTATEDYLQWAIGYIIAIMNKPPKKIPLMSYGDGTKHAINHISHILHRSTYQPCLQILPLLVLLPQTQNENLQLHNIPRRPVPSPRVETVSQPPRLQLVNP